MRFQFLSRDGVERILPMVLRVDVRPAPEMNTLLPIVALLEALAATNAWRKRRGLA